MQCICLLTWVGCSATQTSNTARTSTEQLLISNAIDQSLNKVDFTPFSGADVFVDDKYVDCVDKSYVIASVRHRVLSTGARLVDSADQANVVLEIRSGAVGTTSSDSFIGVPEVTVPGMMTLPEVRLMERKRQEGMAKIGIVAYDPKTRQVLGNGGVSLARSDDSNWFVAGIGPFQNGSVRNEVSHSTQGPAAITRNRLPVTVAFSPPAMNSGEQIATEKPNESEKGVNQASHDKPTSPDWSQTR